MFSAQGELLARSAAIDDVAIDAAGPGAAERFEELEGTVWVHPSPGHDVAARVVGEQVVVDGIALRGRATKRVALLASVDGGPGLAMVAADTLDLTPVDGMDPSLGLVRVRGAAPVASLATVSAASPAAVEAACRRAISYELIGLAATMLSMASEYAGTRVQFGQPIGAFQSVKHRLADVLVAVRSAEVVADESWEVAADGALAATAAKCLAGRAGRLAAENCLQVMGAIRFTEEHVLHRYIARATVLDVLYGSARSLRVDLGRALLARGSMPRPDQP